MENVISHALGQAIGPQILELVRRVYSMPAVWYDRYTQRRLLLELDSHLLADVGLTRAAADAEGRKPFWVR